MGDSSSAIGPPLTLDELDAVLESFETRYDVRSDVFARRYADRTDDLAEVDETDAEAWSSFKSFRDRLEAEKQEEAKYP